MAAKIRWNLPAFRKLRTDPAVQADILRRAEKIAEAAGDGFKAVQSPARNRARAAVVAVTPEAVARNARDQSLLKALDAGRG